MASTPSVTLSNFTGIDFNQILHADAAAAQVPIAALQNQLVGVNTAISTLGHDRGRFQLAAKRADDAQHQPRRFLRPESALPEAPFTAGDRRADQRNLHGTVLAARIGAEPGVAGLCQQSPRASAMGALRSRSAGSEPR